MKVERSLKIFKEVITPRNIEAMSEMIAICEMKYLISLAGTPMIEIRDNLLNDINNKNKSNYVLSNSYDLVQQVALLLSENIGKKLNDIHHLNKKGKIITIQMQACKEITKITNLKYRRMKTDFSLEAMLENNKLPYIETIKDFEEIQEESYKKVDTIVKSLELNEIQKTALNCRINGMSYPKIAKEIHRAISTTYDCLKTIQKRYMAYYG